MSSTQQRMVSTRLSTDVAFDGPGKRHGYIRLPQSTHESAYGFVPIPLVVISGRPGPTTLLTAGNHGDEYLSLIHI